jgi:hypothetical protein
MVKTMKNHEKSIYLMVKNMVSPFTCRCFSENHAPEEFRERGFKPYRRKGQVPPSWNDNETMMGWMMEE